MSTLEHQLLGKNADEVAIDSRVDFHPSDRPAVGTSAEHALRPAAGLAVLREAVAIVGEAQQSPRQIQFEPIGALKLVSTALVMSSCLLRMP